MLGENLDSRRMRLVKTILELSGHRLSEVEALLAAPTTGPQHAVEEATDPPLDWPHAPPHRLSNEGTFMVTGGTCNKAHFFRGANRLDTLQGELLARAKTVGWQLEAWAVFSNHYHFIAHALPGADSLRDLVKHLHGSTANVVNDLDGSRGRQVWFNFWDTQLTYEASYLARLNYVLQNPVKHGLVDFATDYPWCSAAWYERTAAPAQVQTVRRFKIDKVKVIDDFEPVL